MPEEYSGFSLKKIVFLYLRNWPILGYFSKKLTFLYRNYGKRKPKFYERRKENFLKGLKISNKNCFVVNLTEI